MSSDQTLPQDVPERLRSQELSLQRGVPPVQVPGYDLERLLGIGAYGEVWVAVERNTGRRVAIKFYAHRGGLDWSLLSREVEKLAFLFADRYVVQLIGVGWDAEPPYYIMEYLEHGSLAEQLQQGPLPVGRAVEIFQDVAVGLAHAHAKGVLHCDVKPANVLLDQDGKPRLADFGQSRLSHEQAPALGTLFYMAPEQADLNAVPDARWDVYALGSLLYCMLTGDPPYRHHEAVAEIENTADLSQRLAQYRRLIRRSTAPTEHRNVPGVDRELAAIVDNCLAPQAEKRYPNVQVVLDAVRARAVHRARRPMMLLGAILPLLLLGVVALFAWGGFTEVLERSDVALTNRALESNRFAAQYVARTVASELDSRLRSVEQLAGSSRTQSTLREANSDPDFRELLLKLSDPDTKPSQLEKLQDQFRKHAKRKDIQKEFDEMITGRRRPSVTSWVLADARGLQLARYPEKGEVATVGKNFAWRSYFSGLPSDMPPTWRPRGEQHVKDTTLSPVYFGQGSNKWMVAVSVPVFDEDNNDRFLGVVALTMEVGRFGELQGSDDQFAVLVDWRDGDNKGVILQHPLFDQLLADRGSIPDRFKQYRLAHTDLPVGVARTRNYLDPLSEDPDGKAFRKHWLAQMEPVVLRGQDSGWLVIIQESYDTAIGASLARLRAALSNYGLIGLAVVVLLLAGLWMLALHLLRDVSARPRGTPARGNDRSSDGSSASPAPAEVVAGPATETF